MIEDAARWTLTHRSIMDSAPLQLYDSALLFSPQQSTIRQHFDTEAPISIEKLCPSFQEWDTCLMTIYEVSSYYPCLEVSPDRTRFAIVRADKVTISILDASTGDYLKSFRADAGDDVHSVSYHPDGRHLASLSRDRQVMIWDIDNQECLQRFEPRKSGRVKSRFDDGIYRVHFSMDGHLLAFSSGSKTIELWDVWESVNLRTFYDGDLHHDDEIEWLDWGLAQSNIPLLLVVKYIDVWHSVHIDVWHSGTGQQLSNSAEIGSKFRAAAVGPDGRQLAVATDKGISIVRWDTNLTTQKIIDRDSIDRIHDITWAADGKSLAIALDSPSVARSGIVLWDLEKQAKLVCSSGYSSYISRLRYGKNNILATIDYLDHTLKIWSVELNSDLPVSVKEATSSLPVILEQGPNKNLAVFKESGDFEFLNAVTGNGQQSIPYSSFEFVDFQFGPENYFAVLSERGVIEIWDLASGDCTNKFQIYDEDCDGDHDHDWPAAMAFGTAGWMISIGRQLKIWNLDTGTSLNIPHSFEEAKYRHCACSSDGRLAYNWSNSEVVVWGCDWTKERQHLMEVGWIDGLSFNANGLLMIKKYNAVEIWNCEDGSMIQNYIIPREIRLVGWDLQYQSGLDTKFGIIDLEVEEEDCGGTSSEASAELPWCPRSLRLAWTENSAWLMKGSKRVLWIPRGSVIRYLFSVRTDLETDISTVAMAHSVHVMILRISAGDL
jgi:WD40 repeat protein